MKIAVVGLGYVGLPLSLQFARSCVSVLGIDVDPTKVQLLNNGQSYIKHIEQPAIGSHHLCTDTAEQKSRTRSVVHYANRPVDRAAPRKGGPGGSGIDYLSWNDRR